MEPRTNEQGAKLPDNSDFVATAAKLAGPIALLLVGQALSALGRLQPWAVDLFVGIPIACVWWIAWTSRAVSSRCQHSRGLAAWGVLLVTLSSCGFAWETYK